MIHNTKISKLDTKNMFDTKYWQDNGWNGSGFDIQAANNFQLKLPSNYCSLCRQKSTLLKAFNFRSNCH